ncbi:uncharacterized protein PV09_06546 [Verruconis gallopava]|uniref:Amino acid permease/ SLC12A domain-containing protein n=1 Tax=Verruconis gallopava TaxID=253628 RepID=A0A0D2ASB0_9PEZI|nr:uncharacterized protein PV09_06546 [Verruconis gallopava]KIW02044.1 hypothetical protein PV09_06546 [Verruconis gallopava]
MRPDIERQADEQRPLLVRDEPAHATPGAVQTQQSTGFGKHLNAFNGYALLIGCIIGSGIFASPAAVDTNVPSPGAALLIWLIGGLLAWTGAATLAELGTALPGEGSVQEYLKYIYGDFAGFLAAYTWIVAIVPSTLSLLCIVFVETAYSAANSASKGTASGWEYKFISILVLIINVMLNCINTKTSARLGNFFALVKLFSVALPVLVGLAVAIIYGVDHSKDFGGKDWHERGWFTTRPSVTPGGTINWDDVSMWKALGHYSTAIYAGLWAYCGWDGANYIAAELQNPGRQLPLALNTAIPTVIASYVLVNAAYYILLPWNEIGLTDAIAINAVKGLLGKGAGIVFAILICLVIIGAINSNVFVAGRLTVAAANKSYIPYFFAYIGSIRHQPSRTEKLRFDAPFNALILSTLLASAYMLIGNFRALLTFIGLTQYTFFFFTVFGDVILRFRQPELSRPFKPNILIPVIFSLVSAFLVIRGAVFSPIQLGVLVAELGLGGLIYWSQKVWIKCINGRRS